MASKTFLLLALAFVAAVLITSEMVVAKEVASNHDSEVDGRGGYNDPHGEYNRDEGYHRGGGRYHGRRGGHGGYGGCKYGCCGRRHYNGGGCKCCSTAADATTYKQTQN